jgi:hypothetical protein
MAPGVVIIEVFIALAQPIHPLSKQVQRGMAAAVRITRVGQALGHTLQKTDPPIDLPQQQHARIAGHVASLEFHFDPATSHRRKQLNLFGTICHGGTSSKFNLST